MKKHIVILTATILPAISANAAITITDPTAGGIGYQWTVTIGANETLTTPNNPNSHVGAWSWNDTGFVEDFAEYFGPLAGPNMGWTHTTSWTAVNLTEAATLTIIMGSNSSIPEGSGFRPSDQLRPAFTIWSGWDSTSDFSNSHIYENYSLINWSDDLTALVGRQDNSTESTASLTLTLPAGYYTIALGSNRGNAGSTPNQGYYATFITTPVPEPSTAALGALAIGAAFLRRRRHS